MTADASLGRRCAIQEGRVLAILSSDIVSSRDVWCPIGEDISATRTRQGLRRTGSAEAEPSKHCDTPDQMHERPHVRCRAHACPHRDRRQDDSTAAATAGQVEESYASHVFQKSRRKLCQPCVVCFQPLRCVGQHCKIWLRSQRGVARKQASKRFEIIRRASSATIP